MLSFATENTQILALQIPFTQQINEGQSHPGAALIPSKDESQHHYLVFVLSKPKTEHVLLSISCEKSHFVTLQPETPTYYLDLGGRTTQRHDI